MLNVWCWVTVNSGLIGFLFGWFYNKNKGGWPSSEDLSETKITAPHLYATLQTKLNKIQSGRPTSSYLALDVLHTQLLWACHRYLVQGRIVWNYIIWIMLRCQSYSLFVPSHPTWTGETRSNLFPTFDEVIIHPRIGIITVNLKKSRNQAVLWLRIIRVVKVWQLWTVDKTQIKRCGAIRRVAAAVVVVLVIVV